MPEYPPTYTSGSKLAPYQNTWNGVTQEGQELPEGAYYYVLTLRGGNKSVIHGSVLVIR